MKSVLLPLPLLFAAAIPAIAQDDTATEEHAAKFTIDTPIQTLMADEAARDVVLAELPGLDEHPAYGQFKAMSLKAVQPYSQGMVTDEMLANISAGLAEIH
ncbi:MAG: hypothetical protein CL803_13035 [Citromicrobium sp.]|nr:hypothetical protein [Citromicrobium sp.]